MVHHEWVDRHTGQLLPRLCVRFYEADWELDKESAESISSRLPQCSSYARHSFDIAISGTFDDFRLIAFAFFVLVCYAQKNTHVCITKTCASPWI